MPVPRISKEDLKSRLDSATPPMVIDARLKYPYEHSSVTWPGAVRHRPSDPVPPLLHDRDIVVYDSDPIELASSLVAAQQIRQGCRAVSLRGGIAEWLAAKLPTERKDAPQQEDRPNPGH